MTLTKSFVLATLMAANLFSACVLAQSNVALSGVPEEFVGRQQYVGQNEKKVLNSGGLITSCIAFTGSERLGGGLRANFDLTQLLRLDTGVGGRFDGNAFWGSRSTVGISDPFGEINLGRMDSPLFFSPTNGDTFELENVGVVFLHTLSGGQPIRSSGAATDSEVNNSVSYSSPTIAGFRTTLQYGLAEISPSKGRFGYSFDYTIGDLNVGISGDQIKAARPTGETNQKALSGGAAYVFKVVKLFVLVKDDEQKTLGSDYQIHHVGVQVPIGLLKIMASFTRTNLDRGTLPDLRRDTPALGADYFLSKPTDLDAIAT